MHCVSDSSQNFKEQKKTLLGEYTFTSSKIFFSNCQNTSFKQEINYTIVMAGIYFSLCINALLFLASPRGKVI